MSLVGRSLNFRRAGALSARFLVVGGVSTLIEVAAFNLLILAGMGAVLAKVIASLIALVNAWIGNREWAFRSRGRTGTCRQLVRFLAVNALCTLIGAGTVWLGIRGLESVAGDVGPIGLNLVNIASIGCITVVRFALYHLIVFPRGSAIPATIGASDRLGG